MYGPQSNIEYIGDEQILSYLGHRVKYKMQYKGKKFKMQPSIIRVDNLEIDFDLLSKVSRKVGEMTKSEVEKWAIMHGYYDPKTLYLHNPDMFRGFEVYFMSYKYREMSVSGNIILVKDNNIRLANDEEKIAIMLAGLIGSIIDLKERDKWRKK